jgi:hypothetical protein
VLSEIRLLYASVPGESAVPKFEYSSFLSYRHGQGQIKQRFIEEFHRALTGELELLRGEEVFVDRERVKGGDFYNPALGRAVYQSATLIVIYQPNYFDLLHPYCAREYRGMRELEKDRLAMLPNVAERDHGLIVPVVLRGAESIPAELSALRQHEDFSKFMLMDEELSKHPQYAPKIKEIAEYIDARCRSLEAAEVPFEDARAFQLPDEDSTRRWIQSLNLSRSRFPGGGRV